MKMYLMKNNCTIELHEGVKYEMTEEDFENDTIEIKYNNVEAFEVVYGEGAKEIEAEGNEIDEYHEYLVLYMDNGETATFRNSHVDMFNR